MTWRANAEKLRAAALAAAISVLFLSGTAAYSQRAAARAAARQSRSVQSRPAGPSRPMNALPQRPQARLAAPVQNRPQAVAPAYGPSRPYMGQGAPAAGYPGGAAVRPALPAQSQMQMRPATNNAGIRANPAPPGHLQDWLDQHRNVPVQNQEQMLRNDPNFGRLPSIDQQRLVQQLRQVNKMPEQQRDRRLERAEVIEHMSPQERQRLNVSSERLATLPSERQTAVKRAFQDLRSVPEDQRPMVLNSARYQGAFSPEERGILTDLLRAEPYEAPR